MNNIRNSFSDNLSLGYSNVSVLLVRYI